MSDVGGGTATAEITLRDEGIVVTRIAAGVQQSLADARQNLAATIEACGPQKRPLLVDISRCQPLEPEVRHYYTGEVLVESFLALAHRRRGHAVRPHDGQHLPARRAPRRAHAAVPRRRQRARLAALVRLVSADERDPRVVELLRVLEHMAGGDLDRRCASRRRTTRSTPSPTASTCSSASCSTRRWGCARPSRPPTRPTAPRAPFCATSATRSARRCRPSSAWPSG